MTNDPDFRKDAAQAGVELGPVRYDQLEGMIEKILSAPADVRERAKRYLE
jgi:hypothetical protein